MTTATGFDCVLASPLGRLGIHLEAGRLAGVEYLPDTTLLQAPADPLARRVAVELDGYFRDPRRGFSVPLAPAATPFQQRVRVALQGIPVGQTRCYGELAARLGSAARAVGNACRRNPLSIIVPCHRVVAATGPGGYGGRTGGRELDRKLWLLAHEGAEPGP